MSMDTHPNTHNSRFRPRAWHTIAAGLLALSCSGNEKTELVFDDLGGGSPFIMVYPGTGDSKEDMKHVARFGSGAEVEAECKQLGREVTSDPSVGEEPAVSSHWIRIHDESLNEAEGQSAYATAVYVEDRDELLGQLDDCDQ